MARMPLPLTLVILGLMLAPVPSAAVENLDCPLIVTSSDPSKLERISALAVVLSFRLELPMRFLCQSFQRAPGLFIRARRRRAACWATEPLSPDRTCAG